MAIRAAVSSDLPAITALWGEAFGDGPEAVSFFFESFPDCLSYVAEAHGEIAAMVHALPQVLSPDIPAAYVYAVATAKAHRGKGLCRALLEEGITPEGFVFDTEVAAYLLAPTDGSYELEKLVVLLN